MTTRQALLKALEEAGEKRPEEPLLDLVRDAALLGTPGQANWRASDEQLLEGLKKLMA